MYKFKIPCQGCGKSGVDVPRYSVDQLCHSCQQIYNKGRAIDQEQKYEYVRMFQHHYAFRGDDVNKLAHKLLASLNNPTAEWVDSMETLKHSSGSNGSYYTIPKHCLQPMKDFFAELDTKYLELNKKMESLPREAKEAAEKARSDIYNEGVDAGKNLLVQLNNGQITMDDFSKELKYR